MTFFRSTEGERGCYVRNKVLLYRKLEFKIC
jgi:hypothetical protein